MTDISTNDHAYHQSRQIKLRKVPPEEPSVLHSPPRLAIAYMDVVIIMLYSGHATVLSCVIIYDSKNSIIVIKNNQVA